jgi:cell division protein FtsQ
MAVYQRLVVELDANGQHLSDQISEIDLTDPEDARVMMPEQGADILAHFGEDRFLERYQRYRAHIAEWRQQYPKLAAVDLRYDQQVVLQMAHGANAVEAAADPNSAPDSAPASASDSSASQPPSAGVADTSAPASVKPAAGVSATPSAVGNPAGKTSAKSQTAGAKSKSAKSKSASDKKKHAETQRAALPVNKGKPSPATRPAAVAGQGQ